ncbi:hypothetical protein DRQ09_01935 [candidate division KSB1 bacterium]|nr:MAG: hypothetical protein DRQ09_01935 [candidate division KSB1 bacterium]
MNRYFDRVHKGIPIDDVEIIDMHAHLGPYYNMHIPDCSAESMIKNMDLCGIDKAVISPNIGLSSDFVSGNNLMLQTIKSYRQRFYGACIVNGNYPVLSMRELDRCFKLEKDVVIIKLHPALTRCKMNDKRMKPVYRFASEHKLFILVHTWLDEDPYGNQDIFAEVAKEYPDIKWIMGHSGGPYGSYKAVEIAKKLPNVFLDIAISMRPARQIEFLVKEIGSERIFFGTDNPFLDPRPQIGRVCLADISQKDKENIFSKNARKYIEF